MILVTVGTQRFSFNRLIEKVDNLVGQGLITDHVIVQIGNSDYHPIYCSYIDFLPENEFDDLIKKSETVITHGGIGTITKSLFLEKKVIIVPRMKKYKEHVDNHQIEIGKKFSEMGYTLFCRNVDNLNEMIEEVAKKEFRRFQLSWYGVAMYVQNYLKSLEDE